jgi:hypothetical protein
LNLFNNDTLAISSQTDVARRGQLIIEKRRQRIESCGGTASQCAFPDTEDAPPLLNEPLEITPISFAIVGKFGRPEFRPGTWNLEIPASAVRMPEATMHQDRGLPAREYKVGSTWQTGDVDAVAKTHSPQSRPELQLRLGVLAADSRHHSGPRGSVDYINHGVAARADEESAL